MDCVGRPWDGVIRGVADVFPMHPEHTRMAFVPALPSMPLGWYMACVLTQQARQTQPLRLCARASPPPNSLVAREPTTGNRVPRPRQRTALLRNATQAVVQEAAAQLVALATAGGA